MAKIYFEAVQAGKRTLDSVPKRWRDKVSEMLQEANSEAESVDGEGK